MNPENKPKWNPSQEKSGALPFNKWSKSRINQGVKVCASRFGHYGEDSRVEYVMYVPLWFVKKYLYSLEGADSPEEFEEIWKKIYRGVFEPSRYVYVHFGNFKEVIT